MKALQNKLLILIVSSTLFPALVVMAIAFSNYGRIVENNSGQIMQLMCSEKRQTIDEKLLNIEQGVHTLYHFAMDQINDTENFWQNEEKYEKHINSMRELIKTTAKYTDGAVTAYYRLDASIKGPKEGVWMLKNESGDFVEYETTDISLYDKDDVERVGWYYIPVANGKETWINPYYNKNMGEEIISYVVPIILDTRVIGVVGMDISTSLLYETTKNVEVYDTGYAFLMDDEGNFVYHPEMTANVITEEFNNQHKNIFDKSVSSAQKQSVEKYRWNNIDIKMTAQKMRNGMIFTVCVPEQEIRQPQKNVAEDSIVVITLILSAFVAVTISITKVIVKMIYTDVMTRVGNKTAYSECVDTIYKRIRNKEKLDFVVVVFDINDLKKTNDTYGHAYGDKLIQNGAAIIKKIWGNKSVYRIGGDEFAAVCIDMTKEDAEKKIAWMEKEIENYNMKNNGKELYLQMGIGMSVYNPENDMEYQDVFHRADNAMYEDKKKKKSRLI